MNAYLLRHAIENVWCNPTQDRQYVYRLARLSPRRGVRGNINLFYEVVALPTINENYHVYQIGKIAPKWLGLPDTTRRWIRLSELMVDHQLFCDLYVDNGIQFPRFDCYVWLTQARNLVIAVKINPRIHDLDKEHLYLRFYSNAFFQSARSEGRRHIHYVGRKIVDANDLIVFQHECLNLLANNEGEGFYYVNGRFVDTVSPATSMIGDYVEFVLDGSIKRVVNFKVSDLEVFDSTVDDTLKYILHYDDPSVDTIEYLDDVDCYLVQEQQNNRFTGITYHRNTQDWLRMLTHKDYSIPTGRIQSFFTSYPDDPRHWIDPSKWPASTWTSPDSLTLKLYIRHSGYQRALGPDSHRIQELYRLSSKDILKAMTGDDATLDIWRAESLENAPYVRFMSADPSFVYPITFNLPEESHPNKVEAQEFAGDVYGYHAAATILADTPKVVYEQDGKKYADLPYEHRHNATVYEYNAQGVLLGYHYHTAGLRYIVRDSACTLVEVLTGRGGSKTNTTFGKTSVTVPYGYNYRVYISPMWAGRPTGDWRDITEVSDRHEYGFLDDTTDTVKWVWTYDPTLYYGVVRIDDKFLAVDLDLRKANGHLRFNVGSDEIHDGVSEWRTMEIPIGQLDVFLNGRSLVPNLDYTVHWPEVVIHNVEYLTDSDIQRIHYRGFSFCDLDFKLLPEAEVGFLKHGVLSRDNGYDIHSYKVKRVVVDGRYYSPDAVVYDEDYNDSRIVGVRNGAPYMIQNPPVVFRDVYKFDQAARREDDARDRAISNYMSDRFPPKDRGPADFIPDQYHLISVFANKLLHDLKEGYLYPAGIEGHYSDEQVKNWCRPYGWLLDYDICNQDYDETYVEVWPHWFGEPVGLDLYKYQFYKRALQIHLKRVPDISPFVKIISLEA